MRLLSKAHRASETSSLQRSFSTHSDPYVAQNAATTLKKAAASKATTAVTSNNYKALRSTLALIAAKSRAYSFPPQSPTNWAHRCILLATPSPTIKSRCVSFAASPFLLPTPCATTPRVGLALAAGPQQHPPCIVFRKPFPANPLYRYATCGSAVKGGAKKGAARGPPLVHVAAAALTWYAGLGEKPGRGIAKHCWNEGGGEALLAYAKLRG